MRRISNSELDDFRRCPRLHHWKHVRKLERNEPPSPLKAAEIGTTVHRALEDYYRGTSTQPEVLRNLQTAHDLAAEHAPGSDREKAADLVLAVVEGYFDWLAETGSDQGLDFIATEQVISRDLPGLPVTLVGKLDGLISTGDDERLTPLDHKTTGYHLTVRIPYLKRQTQPKHYLWILDPLYQAREMVLNVLRQSRRTERSTGPFYERAIVRVNTVELEAYERHVTEWAAGILAADERETLPPPSPGDDCSWRCPFFEICPSADNGDDIEHLIAENFHRGNPMARYGEDDE